MNEVDLATVQANHFSPLERAPAAFAFDGWPAVYFLLVEPSVLQIDFRHLGNQRSIIEAGFCRQKPPERLDSEVESTQFLLQVGDLSSKIP